MRAGSTSAETSAPASTGPEVSESGRRALRRVIAGVSVLTGGLEGISHGVTVSPVFSISREPLVLGVCLRPTSAFGALIRRAGYFSVNVLSQHQTAVARRFADPARPSGGSLFVGLNPTGDPLTGAPLISGCLAHISCRLMDCRRVGDHDLIMAEVVGGAPASDTDAPGLPLVTYAGRLQAAVIGAPPASSS